MNIVYFFDKLSIYYYKHEKEEDIELIILASIYYLEKLNNDIYINNDIDYIIFIVFILSIKYNIDYYLNLKEFSLKYNFDWKIIQELEFIVLNDLGFNLNINIPHLKKICDSMVEKNLIQYEKYQFYFIENNF
jgi:hypothetical protein